MIVYKHNVKTLTLPGYTAKKCYQKKNYFLKLKTEAFKTLLQLSTKISGIPARETSQMKPNQT